MPENHLSAKLRTAHVFSFYKSWLSY